ncbi:nuclease-related domain-containing protein [Planosporangium sp. 12N6]|uniref:nuclease-related domain-containing protein n=1 Tax=Planosporangium spinosum TaxID=3402278 RepID=UPI003CF33B3C
MEGRTSALEWIRSRRTERETRRAELAHQRAAQRLEALGDNWRVLDLQATAGSDRMSFLAVGPGGIFAVTVKDHGRSRVSFSGDVVQIDGRRPKYVQEARKVAKRAAIALTRIAGVSVPVMPVLAFAGTGAISVYGMPKGVIISSYQELSRVLNARGHRLGPDTVEKVYALAADPATWINPPYVPLADRYRWYSEGDSSVGTRR